MIGVIGDEGAFITEDSSGFLKRYAVFALVRPGLPGVPCETKPIHKDNIL